MSVFDRKRLPDDVFKLDVERMRRGWYSDKYFANIGRMLGTLSAQGYRYAGLDEHTPPGTATDDIAVGDIEVEMQWFTRRAGATIVVGVDKALAMLRAARGSGRTTTSSRPGARARPGPSTTAALSNTTATRHTSCPSCVSGAGTVISPCWKRRRWAS